MKRFLLTAVLGITALGLSATTAMAASGRGVTVNHYNVTYPWSPDGVQSVNCVGVHQTGKNFPGTPGPTGSGGQDSFTCTSTNGQQLAFLTPGETLSLRTWDFAAASCDPSCWISDYNGATATSFAGAVSSDGSSFTAVAGYYP